MVGRFAIIHFYGGFLDRKIIALLNGETEDFFFLGSPLDVLEVCGNERGVLRKSMGLKCVVGKGTQKGKKDNKEWW